MGKLTTYILIMSGLMLLFYFSGLIQNTGNSSLLTILLNPFDFPNISFTAKLIALLEGIGAAGLTIGLFVSGKPELAIIAPMIIYLFNLGWDFLAVYAKVAETNPVIGMLLFSPLFVVYVMAFAEFWRGRD